MPKRYAAVCFACMAFAFSLLFVPNASYAKNYELKRVVLPKPFYQSIPQNLNTSEIVVKFKEGISQPKLSNNGFASSSSEWNTFNNILSFNGKVLPIKQHFKESKEKLDEMRQIGMQRSGIQLPDLSLYNRIDLDESMTDDEILTKINGINALDIVEIAYFPPIPEIATMSITDASQATPNFETGQYYLEAAPTGVDAKYAWGVPGGRGENIKVVDIEGNWIQTHEDLHGGVEDFHIAGNVIDDAGWWNHGTAVLGEIAADSNSFGVTGISFGVDLGTVSIGSMSTASAINTAVNNSDTGDVILIELHAPGPRYDTARADQKGYVCMEYWQENFDAILQASAMGRIVVEAAGNGAEDFDDVIYGLLFDPSFRFSGAIIVGASSAEHVPASFTNYGQRVDVHAFGTWDVYSLGYGDLFGSNNNNFYTSSFAGTSSASPIITGSCAVLQGVNKANHGRVLDHNEIRTLLTDYSTPQTASSKHIGPLPDLKGAVDQIMGISFVADTTFGWTPLNVQFSASSGLSVDTWTWDFGDGDSSFIQSPLHTYQDQGLFTVGIEIDAAGDIRHTSRQSYIVALADTMKADSIETTPGTSTEITISLNNTVPARLIQIPIEFDGDMTLSIDSFSTVGCRTDYFEEQQYVQYDLWNKRFVVLLTASNLGNSPDLAPGSGAVLKLYFTASASAVQDDLNPIITDGYNTYLPRIESQFGNYDVKFSNGAISIGGCCTGIRGNVDGDTLDQIDINDIVYLVNYSFVTPSGPAPVCSEEADVDASGALDITDLVYLVSYSFGNPGGPAPVSCY